MVRNRILLAAFALVAFAGVAIGQGSGLWPNFPVVGSGSYCAVTTNGVCTQTIPAGPTAITGAETVPANTGLGNQSPTTVLVPMSALNALPITFSSALVGNLNSISASSTSGGYVFTAAGTISQVNIQLPSGAIQGQQFVISSNRTITTLNVSASGSDSIGANSSPTVLTASTTAPQGYRFVYNKAATTWYRLQ